MIFHDNFSPKIHQPDIYQSLHMDLSGRKSLQIHQPIYQYLPDKFFFGEFGQRDFLLWAVRSGGPRALVGATRADEGPQGAEKETTRTGTEVGHWLGLFQMDFPFWKWETSTMTGCWIWIFWCEKHGKKSMNIHHENRGIFFGKMFFFFNFWIPLTVSKSINLFCGNIWTI